MITDKVKTTAVFKAPTKPTIKTPAWMGKTDEPPPPVTTPSWLGKTETATQTIKTTDPEVTPPIRQTRDQLERGYFVDPYVAPKPAYFPKPSGPARGAAAPVPIAPTMANVRRYDEPAKVIAPTMANVRKYGEPAKASTYEPYSPYNETDLIAQSPDMPFARRDFRDMAVTGAQVQVPAWLKPPVVKPPVVKPYNFMDDYTKQISARNDKPASYLNYIKPAYDFMADYNKQIAARMDNPDPYLNYIKRYDDMVNTPTDSSGSSGGGGGGGFGTNYGGWGNDYGSYNGYQSAWTPDMGLFQWNYHG